uniref:Uncharacterized protein n=1 Tax=Oryza glumipatula TaxID=40148 RepID=A0A0E0B809_9ORYZ
MTSVASPKSQYLSTQPGPTRMFAGLTSRWIRPAAWIAAAPARSCRIRARVSASEKGRPTMRSRSVRLPTNSMTRYTSPLFHGSAATSRSCTTDGCRGTRRGSRVPGRTRRQRRARRGLHLAGGSTRSPPCRRCGGRGPCARRCTRPPRASRDCRSCRCSSTAAPPHRSRRRRRRRPPGACWRSSRQPCRPRLLESLATMVSGGSLEGMGLRGMQRNGPLDRSCSYRSIW